MSILTKICIVILLVLILLACPVFITQATVHPNYRLAYEREVQHSKLFEMSDKSEKLAHATTKAELDAVLLAAKRISDEKQSEIDRLAALLRTEQTSRAKLENDLTRQGADIAKLKGEAITFNRRNDLLARQLDDARKKIDKLTHEIIRVSDLLKQTEAEKTRVDQLARGYHERIRELEEENEELRKAGAVAKTSAAEEITPSVGEKITGTVDAVKGDLASINIGSAKGIRPGMKLTVYRGDRLVAYLRINEVEVDQAAGIIIDRQLDPVRGDKVTTSLLK